MLFPFFAGIAILFLELTLKAFNVSLKWRIVGLALSLAAAAYVYPRETSSSAPPRQTTQTPILVASPAGDRRPTPNDGRIRIDATPDEITGLYKSKTSYQADSIIAGYRGIWIDVESEIANVSARNDKTILVISSYGKGNDLFKPILSLEFSRPMFEPQLSAMRKGDRIATTCQFASADRSGIELNNCEIHSVTQLPR